MAYIGRWREALEVLRNNRQTRLVVWGAGRSATIEFNAPLHHASRPCSDVVADVHEKTALALVNRREVVEESRYPSGAESVVVYAVAEGR